MKTLIAVVFSLAAAAPASAQMFGYNPVTGQGYGMVADPLAGMTGYAAPDYQQPLYTPPPPVTSVYDGVPQTREVVCRQHHITGEVRCRY